MNVEKKINVHLLLQRLVESEINKCPVLTVAHIAGGEDMKRRTGTLDANWSMIVVRLSRKIPMRLWDI